MIPTYRFFDTDSYCFAFDAVVLDVEARTDGKYDIILDKTAFFPEMGGQFGDPGILDGQNVLDVQINDGIIRHTVENSIQIGKNVHGEIDSRERFRRMQQHTGEHIVCGIAHKLYGLENVGFHLGHDDVLVDLDGKLTREQLELIEAMANRAVYECRKITVSFPSHNELPKLTYRSKLDLKENVRLVTIDGYDVCACCAPHVGNTGEVGIIKILDFMHYKGGTRLHLQCGSSTLEDYGKRYKTEYTISTMLSVPQEKVVDGVMKLQEQINDLSRANSELRQRIIQMTAECIEKTDKNICIFEDDTDMVYLRRIANACISKCGGICAVFGGSDDAGYKYVMLSNSVNLRNISKEINQAINGRGGGSPEMISGNAQAPSDLIKAYFNGL